MSESEDIFRTHRALSFFAVTRNGVRSNFPGRHPVRREAMYSSSLVEHGRPSTRHLVDMEAIDLEARCPNL
jgi:hypothetical protein